MDDVRLKIRDGLSQENREFKELVEGFYAIEKSSLKDFLETLRNFCEEHDCPDVLGGVDIDELVSKVEGESDGYADPAAAVYATCASLLMRVKKVMNLLPDKRIDFYYEKILGERPLGTQGDSAHVIFPNPPKGIRCELPAGTKFLAGIDEDGRQVEFESVKNVEINDAAVEKIMTLAVNDDLPMTYADIPVYSAKEFFDDGNRIPYPLFGLTRSGHRSVNSKNARLGVAYASPVLLMKAGQREIKTTFIFAPESVKGTLLEDGCNPDLFLKTFSSAFKIFLTIENGWYEVDGYQLNANVLDSGFAKNCFSLTVILPESAPSIVKYNAEIHGDLFETKYPVMKVEVNPQTSYNPWKILRVLQLQKIQAEVYVRGLRNFDVCNDVGKLSLSMPIQPFGPLPKVGDTFSIMCEEFDGKKMTSLDLRGEWRGIPVKKDFSDWYKLYPNAPHTNDFKVSIFSLSKNGQIPPANQNVILSNLFSNEESRISKDFHISFRDVLGSCSLNVQYKMRLWSPENAFMHQEYSRVLCNSLMSQALKKAFSAEHPNLPYTPEFENLSIDYRAKCDINTRQFGMLENSGEIFFLRPWGINRKSQLTDENGALYLGLSHTGNIKKLNLFFHLKKDSDYVVSSDIGEFSWSVLCDGTWVNLPAENVLYNTTAGFTTSGIVSLKLPEEMTHGGKLMPGGFAWIRLRPLADWRHCCRLYSVYAQALEVTRCMEGTLFRKIQHAKPGTIKGLSQSREGLSEVCQITESFGGKSPETKAQMRTRVAEFLYHRNRALSARDYERLVLENFPEVHLVKCFPGLKPAGKGEVVSGYVTIVPVSKLVATSGNSWDPCLSGKTLNDIKLFLKERISASANICVVNPFFEKMQVRCNVDLEDDSSEGESLKKLSNAINQFISPWSSLGQTKFFGWTLDEQELKHFILAQDYVKAVRELSILRVVSCDSCNFEVDHTETQESGILRGICPWSVPTPMAKHFLNIVPEIEQSRHISVGYGDLEIGSTFIIQRRNDATK